MNLMRMFVLSVAIVMLFVFDVFAQPTPYPILIDVWQPPFNSDRTRTTAQYLPLEKSSKQWKICVSIPHLKDAYWLGVNYSIIDEAKRLGVSVQLFEAGGYGNLELQRNQIGKCMASGGDGLILSAVSYDGFKDLNLQYAAQGRPVVDMINGVDPEGLAARVAATYWDLGNLVGLHLAEKQKKHSIPLRVAWFPGPMGAGWVAAADAGFNEALAGSSVTIVTTRNGDTGRETQAKLIEEALVATPDIDYIVGTTVTAEAAVKILRQKGLKDSIQVLPYYYGPGVHKGIARGLYPAAPSDLQGYQARLALDTIVRILEGEEYRKHIGARVMMVDRSMLKDFDETSSVAPRGFRPIFSQGSWE